MKSAEAEVSRRFIGRQAILDGGLQLFGHELLFRNGTDNSFSGDQEFATNQVIDSCISMASCFSSRNVFINCTRDVLLDMRVKLLPADTVVLEILENMHIDEPVVEACKQLRKSGFRLALDDFNPEDGDHPLADLADFIKIDFRSSNAAQRQRIYKTFAGRKVTFVAEKVETLDELETARAEGNKLFQGYFHSRPEILSETQIPARKLSYLRILTLLAKDSLNHRELITVLRTEPSLCYRLLRLANSALYGLRSPVSTIQAALLIVGDDTFKKMVMVALVGMLPTPEDHRSLTLALERAYFCESLASQLKEDPQELYMLGMLSTMDSLMGVNMVKLLENLHVGPRMREALLGSPAGMGKALETCKYHEQWNELEQNRKQKMDLQKSASLYFDAIIAAGRALRELALVV